MSTTYSPAPEVEDVARQHCFWDALDGPTILPHDVEEFSAVLSRHGLWTPGLDTFVRAGQFRLEAEAGD